MLNSPEEQLPKKLMETFYRADTFCRKSERNAKLAVKKLQVRRVKKTFGLDYMTLLEKDASPEQLEQCMRDGHGKIDLINKDIRNLRAEKASLDDQLKWKLAHVHGAEDAETEHAHGTEDAEAEHEHGAPSTQENEKHTQPSDSSSSTGTEPRKDQQGEKEAESSMPKIEADEGMGFAVPPQVAEANQEEEFVVLAQPSDAEQEKHKE